MWHIWICPEEKHIPTKKGAKARRLENRKHIQHNKQCKQPLQHSEHTECQQRDGRRQWGQWSLRSKQKPQPYPQPSREAASPPAWKASQSAPSRCKQACELWRLLSSTCAPQRSLNLTTPVEYEIFLYMCVFVQIFLGCLKLFISGSWIFLYLLP